jgi:carboxymethylenebutenolidase
MTDQQVDARRQSMVDMWEKHMAAEFAAKDIDAAMATMTASPFVNHVPVMTGGVGYAEVRAFYAASFLPGHPPDVEIVPIARSVSADCILEELVYRFTHTIEMPWMLPGVKPTGKRAEVAIAAVVLFDGEKIAGERIYWDQASVLAQLGLIDASELPISDGAAARKASDPRAQPSNELITRRGG